MSVTEEWGFFCHVVLVYAFGMRIPFPKQYRYVTNHLYLYLTNYYIFVCTFTLFLLTICLAILNASIFSNMTFTPIVLFGQISSGPMDL